MNFDVIIAARQGSSRLPGKGLLPLMGIPMLAFLLRRLKRSKRARNILVATTDLPGDDALEKLAKAEGFPVFRGDSQDLVKRFVDAASTFGYNDYIVRVTADCPMLDAETLDYCLEKAAGMHPFVLASTKTLFPVGIDFEIYSQAEMKKLHQSAPLSPADREHLTKYFYDHPEFFAVQKLFPRPEWICEGTSFTLDTPADYSALQKMAASFQKPDFSVTELISSLK